MSTNLLIRLRNAANAQKSFFFLKNSVVAVHLLKKLYLEGFIKRVELLSNNNLVLAELKYSSFGVPAFQGIYLFSKVEQKYFVNYETLVRIHSVGIFFLATSEGLLPDYICLKKKLEENYFFI